MGTNYYLRPRGGSVCEHCGRGDDVEELHIGKSSFGWCFSLHIIPELGINDLADWLPLFESGQIRDEYGETISAAEMLSLITERGDPANSRKMKDPGWYTSNHAEPGPNGLARHRLGWHCVKQGEGTWDCVTGEFS